MRDVESSDRQKQAVYCPECGLPAWVEWAATDASTDGPVEHVKVRCFARHWFLMPAERLSWTTSPDGPRSARSGVAQPQGRWS